MNPQRAAVLGLFLALAAGGCRGGSEPAPVQAPEPLPVAERGALPDADPDREAITLLLTSSNHGEVDPCG